MKTTWIKSAACVCALLAVLAAQNTSAQSELMNSLSSLGNLQKSLGGFQNTLKDSLGSLENLKKALRDPTQASSSIDGFLKNFDSLNSQRDSVRDVADQLREGAQDTYRSWDRHLDTITDPKQRDKTARQLDKARAGYEKTIEASDKAQQSLDPFMNNLDGVARTLKANPTAGGLESIGGNLSRLLKDGQKALKSLGGVSKQFDKVMSYLPKV
jgi:phage tail tape-measure protein